MASFLTSFGTGVATGGLNQLNAAAEKTASILDELRPDIERVARAENFIEDGKLDVRRD